MTDCLPGKVRQGDESKAPRELIQLVKGVEREGDRLGQAGLLGSDSGSWEVAWSSWIFLGTFGCQGGVGGEETI